MTQLERRLLTVALLFSMLTFLVIAARGFGAPLFWAAPTAQAATGAWYGSNDGLVSLGATEWPQQGNNWCGVATVEVVANYSYQEIYGPHTIPFNQGGQQQIASDMDSAAAVSEWGTPSNNGIGPGFKADIARDGGTDPRSLAWSILYESAAGVYLHDQGPGYILPTWSTTAYSFHNIIYHGNVYQAITGLARSLEAWRMPISVIMAHGLHSVVVSGVYSINDPQRSSSANVDAVDVWDPGVGSNFGGGYQSAREVLWDNYSFDSDPNMWGSTYASNNNYDPDPAVGIYTPYSTYPTHWIGHYVDIAPDAHATVSPDIAYDENGNAMTHP